MSKEKRLKWANWGDLHIGDVKTLTLLIAQGSGRELCTHRNLSKHSGSSLLSTFICPMHNVVLAHTCVHISVWLGHLVLPSIDLKNRQLQGAVLLCRYVPE